MADDIEGKISALLKRAAHEGTPLEEARTSAFLAAKLIAKHGLVLRLSPEAKRLEEARREEVRREEARREEVRREEARREEEAKDRRRKRPLDEDNDHWETVAQKRKRRSRM